MNKEKFKIGDIVVPVVKRSMSSDLSKLYKAEIIGVDDTFVGITIVEGVIEIDGGEVKNEGDYRDGYKIEFFKLLTPRKEVLYPIF